MMLWWGFIITHFKDFYSHLIWNRIWAENVIPHSMLLFYVIKRDQWSNNRPSCFEEPQILRGAALCKQECWRHWSKYPIRHYEWSACRTLVNLNDLLLSLSLSPSIPFINKEQCLIQMLSIKFPRWKNITHCILRVHLSMCRHLRVWAHKCAVTICGIANTNIRVWECSKSSRNPKGQQCVEYFNFTVHKSS